MILRTAFILISFCFSLEAKKLNVVFILADDMGRDTWGAYGSKDCQTPNIDLLAEEGTRFDRAYCTVAMCAPFRQELYSGRSPWRTGTLPNHSKSVAGTKSIAHYLQPLGYRVALLGKSHVGPKECYPFERLVDVSKKEMPIQKSSNDPVSSSMIVRNRMSPFASLLRPMIRMHLLPPETGPYTMPKN